MCRVQWLGLGSYFFWLVMVKAKVNKNEQYFLVRKLGLGREVVGLSLVITEASRGSGMRW